MSAPVSLFQVEVADRGAAVNRRSWTHAGWGRGRASSAFDNVVGCRADSGDQLVRFLLRPGQGLAATGSSGWWQADEAQLVGDLVAAGGGDLLPSWERADGFT